MPQQYHPGASPPVPSRGGGDPLAGLQGSNLLLGGPLSSPAASQQPQGGQPSGQQPQGGQPSGSVPNQGPCTSRFVDSMTPAQLTKYYNSWSFGRTSRAIWGCCLGSSARWACVYSRESWAEKKRTYLVWGRVHDHALGNPKSI